MDQPLRAVQLCESESDTDELSEKEVIEIEDHTRKRKDENRDAAHIALELAIESGDILILRAAVTRARRERLAGVEEATKILRKLEKSHTKAQQSEKRRGRGKLFNCATASASEISQKKRTQKKKDFYVEKQRKGLCRMHALNAFFQRAKLSEDGFAQMCRDFEKSIGASRGSGDFFFVESDGANILSYVVERDRRYRTVYYAPGTEADLDEYDADALLGYFEFDNGHVWYVMRDGNRWVVLDSRADKAQRQKGTTLRREFGQIFVLRVPYTNPEAAERLRSHPRVPEAIIEP